MIWVITANTNNCRIYHYDKSHAKLDLLKEISHPEFRQKASEGLTTERPGHIQTGISSRSSYEPHMDAKEVEVDRFSKEIADELDKGRKASSYEKLIIVTPPHMNGLLLKHLDKHAKQLVINNIHKDIQHLSKIELVDFLKTHAQYAD